MTTCLSGRARCGCSTGHAVADGDEDPRRRRPRQRRRPHAQRAHLALPHPRHQEEPGSPRRVGRGRGQHFVSARARGAEAGGGQTLAPNRRAFAGSRPGPRAETGPGSTPRLVPSRRPRRAPGPWGPAVARWWAGTSCRFPKTARRRRDRPRPGSAAARASSPPREGVGTPWRSPVTAPVPRTSCRPPSRSLRRARTAAAPGLVPHRPGCRAPDAGGRYPPRRQPAAWSMLSSVWVTSDGQPRARHQPFVDALESDDAEPSSQLPERSPGSHVESPRPGRAARSLDDPTPRTGRDERPAPLGASPASVASPASTPDFACPSCCYRHHTAAAGCRCDRCRPRSEARCDRW